MKKLIILCLGGLIANFAVAQEKLPQVVVFTTGGTIAEKDNGKSDAAKPAISGKELISAVPGLGKIARIKLVKVCNIDSSHMTPAIWTQLSREVDEVLGEEQVKGAVVTHGTDTMAEGAFFLELTLKSKKPVVFTGAMRNASDLSPDGAANIYNATLQAVSDQSKDWGVTVCLNNYVNSALTVRKTSTFNLQTFKSGMSGYLGYINEGKVVRLNDVTKRIKIPLTENNKLPKVALVYNYSGADGKAISYAVEQGAKGIVVAGVGEGNVNPKVADALLAALKKGVVVVVGTDVFYGPTAPAYGVKGAGAYMQERGAILSREIPPRKARLLLMLALAAKKDNKEIVKLFGK